MECLNEVTWELKICELYVRDKEDAEKAKLREKE
jgi:hypothetical protein